MKTGNFISQAPVAQPTTPPAATPPKMKEFVPRKRKPFFFERKKTNHLTHPSIFRGYVTLQGGGVTILVLLSPLFEKKHHVPNLHFSCMSFLPWKKNWKKPPSYRLQENDRLINLHLFKIEGWLKNCLFDVGKQFQNIFFQMMVWWWWIPMVQSVKIHQPKANPCRILWDECRQIHNHHIDPQWECNEQWKKTIV